MNVGMIGTGAISNIHARAYSNIGFRLRVCTDINEEAGRAFAEASARAPDELSYKVKAAALLGGAASDQR